MTPLEILVSKGATLSMVAPYDKYPREFGVVNECRVIREDEGKTWVMWNTLGYEDDAHHTHTMRVVRTDVGKDGSVTMEDCYNRIYIVTEIDSPVDRTKWTKWQEFRKRNKVAVEGMDRRLLENARYIANSWNKD